MFMPNIFTISDRSCSHGPGGINLQTFSTALHIIYLRWHFTIELRPYPHNKVIACICWCYLGVVCRIISIVALHALFSLANNGVLSMSLDWDISRHLHIDEWYCSFIFWDHTLEMVRLLWIFQLSKSQKTFQFFRGHDFKAQHPILITPCQYWVHMVKLILPKAPMLWIIFAPRNDALPIYLPHTVRTNYIDFSAVLVPSSI